MHVPGYILAIICSYLEGRSLVLNYQGAKSEEKQLPGGFGAGTCLGGALFIVKFNGACLRPPIPRPMTQNQGLQVKYIDDASQIASINLKKSLIPDPAIRTRPLNYHIYLSSLIFIQISCPASTAQLPGAGVWLNSPRWARRCCYFTRVVNWCCQAGSWERS